MRFHVAPPHDIRTSVTFNTNRCIESKTLRFHSFSYVILSIPTGAIERSRLISWSFCSMTLSIPAGAIERRSNMTFPGINVYFQYQQVQLRGSRPVRYTSQRPLSIPTGAIESQAIRLLCLLSFLSIPAGAIESGIH